MVSSNSGAGGNRNRLRSRLFLILTYVVSLYCLYRVVRDADLREFPSDIATVHWLWILIAVVADILVYVFHGWRWSLLLRPVARVSFWQSVRAIYVGLFANETLPLRAGEIIRCFLLARWSLIPFSVTVASALIERIFDGFWLMVCLFLTVKYVPLPKSYVDGGMFLGAVILACGVLLAVAMYAKEQALVTFVEHGWMRKLRVLIEDLHLIGHSRYLYFSAAASLPYLLMQIIPIYALMQGYELEASWGAAFCLMVMLRLGSVVPQAPGNLGLFQFIAKQGLVLLGYQSATAARFALVLWVVVTLPLLVAGFIALALTGARMGELHLEAQQETPSPGLD